VHRLQSEIQSKCTTAVTPQLSAYTYGTGTRRVVFLVNTLNADYGVTWEGQSYTIPQKSVTIVDYQGAELYQTSKVDTAGVPTQRVYVPLLNSSNLNWEAYTEERLYNDSVSHPSPQEQISVTRDKTEYLVYSTQVDVDPSESNYQLTIQTRASTAILVLINGDYKGQTVDTRKTNEDTTLSLNFQLANLSSKTINVTLVSASLGIENDFNNQQGPEAQDKKGIVGSVKLNGNTLSGPWWHRPQLNGEKLQIFTPEKTNVVAWSSVPAASSIPAFTWFRSKFDRPSDMKSNDVILLQFASEGFTENSRGHFYLNGFDLGRYYGVSVNSKKVQSNYFIPNDLIQDKDNLFVYIDEAGSTHPSLISFVSTHMEVPKQN
jgi:hypothetical protein